MYVVFDIDYRPINIMSPTVIKNRACQPSNKLIYKYRGAYCRSVNQCSREQYEAAVRFGGQEVVRNQLGAHQC